MDQSCWDLAIVFYYLLLVQTVPALRALHMPGPSGTWHATCHRLPSYYYFGIIIRLLTLFFFRYLNKVLLVV